MLDLVRDAAARVGGVPRLAERLGVSRQALYQWRRIPADKVAALARETGLPERALRPDLFAAASSSSYEHDFAAWATVQAARLQASDFAALDIENLSEEIEALARNERHQIENRLAVLLVHLLKMQFQKEQRTSSWDGTVHEQRSRIARILRASPSLRAYPGEVLAEEYLTARRGAAIETGLPIATFPAECPFAIEDVLDPGFVPAGRDR